MSPVRLILCCLLIAGFYRAPGQTPAIDSLKRVVTQAGSDRQRLDAMLALCDRRESLHSDTMEHYARLALQLAERLGLEPQRRSAVCYVAFSLTKQRQMEAAMGLLEAELPKLRYGEPGLNLYVRYKIQKGRILLQSGQYKEALAVFYGLLSEAERRQDGLVMMQARTNIGWINMEMEHYREAISWLLGSVALAGNRPELERYTGVAFSNLASCYNNLLKFDTAEYYIDRAIAIAGRYQYLTYLANGHAIRADILANTGRFDQAEVALEAAVGIRRKLEDAYYLVSDLAQLAEFYAVTRQPAKGIRVAQDAIAIAGKEGITAKLPLLYTALAHNYEAAGDYRSYGNTLQRLLSVKDSLYQVNSARDVAELRARYDVRTRENTIIRQQLAIARKNSLLYGGILLFLFAAGAGWGLFRSYRRRQRQRVLRMLEAEKRLATAAIAEAAEKERARISADLHDNLGAYAASIAANIDHIRLQPADTVNAVHLEALRGNARAMVAELSDTIWVMKKDALLLTAISDRLKSFIQRVQGSHPEVLIDVEEQIETDHLLPPVQAFHLFKILQEAITNALRHSGGDRVVIRFEAAERWRIRISDNGRGIRETLAGGAAGSGLHSMQERSREAGWQTAVVPNEGPGITVRIEPVG